MKIQYGVVGHHFRARAAKELAERLGAFLAMDDGTVGSLENHDRAWRGAYRSDADFVVVLEDDVILVNNFESHVEDAIRHLPKEGAVSFYTGTGRPKAREVGWALKGANQKEASWLYSNNSYWGPALGLPAHRVSEMLETVQKFDSPYDQRFGSYLRNAQLECFYTLPSLVDHADEGSLLSDTSIARKAHRFGEPTSWNSKAVYIF